MQFVLYAYISRYTYALYYSTCILHVFRSNNIHILQCYGAGCEFAYMQVTLYKINMSPIHTDIKTIIQRIRYTCTMWWIFLSHSGICLSLSRRSVGIWSNMSGVILSTLGGATESATECKFTTGGRASPHLPYSSTRGCKWRTHAFPNKKEDGCEWSSWELALYRNHSYTKASAALYTHAYSDSSAHDASIHACVYIQLYRTRLVYTWYARQILNLY